jgi:hypothetical protein
MARATTHRARRTKSMPPRRSAKVGRPPREMSAAPRVRRRRRTAHAAVRKDTMLMQAAEGPRVRWGVTRPNVKKR